MDILQLVVAFLGGGLVAAFGNWIHSTRSARRQSEIDYLNDQISRLYGPLHFFASQNEQLFQLYNDIHNAYSTEFQGKWSSDRDTQQLLSEEMEAVIDLGNQYVDRVVQNNIQVIELLQTQWHLVDAIDIPVFARFQVDHVRFHTEVMEGRRTKLPWGVVSALDNISYMRPDMIDVVRTSVEAKQARLQKLRPVKMPDRIPATAGTIFVRLRSLVRGRARRT